eukprot:2972406-Pyramimonas_sp.AAC.1
MRGSCGARTVPDSLIGVAEVAGTCDNVCEGTGCVGERETAAEAAPGDVRRAWPVRMSPSACVGAGRWSGGGWWSSV